MKLIFSKSSWLELSEYTIFIDFGQVFQKLWQYNWNLTTFWHGPSYHVTQGKNVSFLYSKSYSPLNFRKTHRILWFCCVPNGCYKEDNLRAGKISPPSPPPPMWNRVNPILHGERITPSSCFSSTYLKCFKSSSWNFLTLKIRHYNTFGKSYQFVIFRAVTMATKLLKVPRRIRLNRKWNFLIIKSFLKILRIKFVMETNCTWFKKWHQTIIWRHYDVIVTFLPFRPFCWWKHEHDVIVTSDIEISQISWLTSKDNPSQILHTKFYASRIKNKQIRRGA